MTNRFAGHENDPPDQQPVTTNPGVTSPNQQRPASHPGTPQPPPPSIRMRHVQPMQGQTRRKPTNAQRGPLYLPCWSMLLMLMGVFIVTVGIVGAIVAFGGNPPADNATAIVRIVTAPPTLLNSQPQVIVPTLRPADTRAPNQNTAQPLVLSGPTLLPPDFTPTPMRILIGATVSVDNVGRNMLNVRSRPGTIGSEVVFRAAERRLFTVVDGPQQADGFTWWRIENPADASQNGWAASNYLLAVSRPAN
jgi:hypothetical protein